MTEQELKKDYPAYADSIFSEFMPDDQEVITWQENVLNKVKGDHILPHYIEKDRDFDVFWGWITHFFAIIVKFVRGFKKIFIDYLTHLDELKEFMKEKDWIQDSRVKINKNLYTPTPTKVYHKINCGYKLSNGSIINDSLYNCTDYIPITSPFYIFFKVLGYNENLNEFSGVAINNIRVEFRDANNNYITTSGNLSLNILESKLGKYFYFNILNAKFIRVSYPNIGNSTLPLYLGIYTCYINEDLFTNTRNEQNIFEIYTNFRKRGSYNSFDIAKQVYEIKDEDSFYLDYLPCQNSGWILNKTSPSYGEFYEKVKIDSIIPNSISNNLLDFNKVNRYFILNQNTSLIIKWKQNNLVKAESVTFNVNIYDKNKNLLSNTILGNWTLNLANDTFEYENIDLHNCIVAVKEESQGLYCAELPIEILDKATKGIFSKGTYNSYNFLNSNQKTYLFCKLGFGISHPIEAYYIKIESIQINGSGQFITDIENIIDVGLYLRRLPITMGFLNNKQYYICYYGNRGSYSDNDAKELIEQKIIPYNGYRVFVKNNYFKDRIYVPLQLKTVYFIRFYKQIHLEILGGTPPYTYSINGIDSIIYSQIYQTTISNYGNYVLNVTDALGSNFAVTISCQPYNNINYKFRLFVDIKNNIQLFIKLFGGTESSYSINKYIYVNPYVPGQSNTISDTNEATKITIPSNTWIDITDLVGNNFSDITEYMTLYIKDLGVPVETIVDGCEDIELGLQALLQDFALDYYDNGKGELVN